MKTVVMWALLIAAACWPAPPRLMAQEPSAARRSVWDRVYTDSQAERGELLYARHCEQCHGSGLEGDAVSEVPALAGDPFLQRWSSHTVDELVARMVRSMPEPAPGSLSRTEYVQLAAYILKANRFPSGFEAIGTDAERLRLLVIERTPSTGAK
jgi:mono/diheme cytochrome c family protein